MAGAKAAAKWAAKEMGWGKFFKTAGAAAWEKTIAKEGLDRLGGNVVQGVVWGAGIGAVSEWAQGGSFWEGAKSGAFRGGLYYGVAGTALGSAARGFDPNTGGIRGSATTLSKQLQAVVRHQGNMKSNIKMKK